MASQSSSQFKTSSAYLSQAFRGETMTGYQKAKRLYILRGSFSVIFACTFFMLASALAGNITS